MQTEQKNRQQNGTQVVQESGTKSNFCSPYFAQKKTNIWNEE